MENIGLMKLFERGGRKEGKNKKKKNVIARFFSLSITFPSPPNFHKPAKTPGARYPNRLALARNLDGKKLGKGEEKGVKKRRGKAKKGGKKKGKGKKRERKKQTKKLENQGEKKKEKRTGEGRGGKMWGNGKLGGERSREKKKENVPREF